MSRSINAVTEQRSMMGAEAGPVAVAGTGPELLDDLPAAHQQGVWGCVDTRFGAMLLAGSEACLCWLDAAPSAGAELPNTGLLAGADWQRSDVVARDLLAHYCAALRGRLRLQIAVRASAFQRAVWSELLRIAPGTTLSYGALAAALGRSGAARAVGTAVAANCVGLFIPCHRIVPAAGGVGQFRWGSQLKQRLLATEAEYSCTAAALLG